MNKNSEFYTEQHSEMDEWEEYLAKYILEDVCGFPILTKSERPDWIVDALGVEVTKAYDEWYNKMESARTRAFYLFKIGENEAANRYLQKAISAGNVSFPDITIKSSMINVNGFSTVCSTISGDLYNTRKSLLLNALYKKLKVLNSGNYVIKPEMNLFMFSLIEMSESEFDALPKHEDLAKSLREKQARCLNNNKNWRGYDRVFVYAMVDALLFEIDMRNVSILRHDIDNGKYNTRLAKLSRKISK